MPQAVQIADDLLRPGDLVDVNYEIAGGNATLVAMAVSNVKRTLAADKRFHYQGSVEFESSENETGTPQRFITFTVQVADPAKVGDRATASKPQEAGLVSVLTLLAVIAGAIAAVGLSYAIVHASTTVRAIAMSNQTDAVKVAALGALSKPPFGIGTLVIGGILAAVLLSGRFAGGQGD
jgi:hypothetical protein